ncbi:ATPase [Nitrincola tapanii]|uniref:ATPase n=1 Tax=Nitrincola tapanii TaxID=1708751 RepID=A0A5A9W8Z6_9GAMM|nr:ATPase [Nitrincola tapanii]KAA0876489.1 ATPase [Nitrincola tapanii]
MNRQEKHHPSSGVEALIEQLRSQGVDKGREEAQALLKDARQEAQKLREAAEHEAEQLLQKAKREAEQLHQAGEAALKMAARDLLLDLKESMARSFADQVERLVEQQMDNREFMQRLILELAGKVCRQTQMDAEGLEVLLPEEFIGLDELRRNAHEYRQGRLSQFVQSLSADLLREGVVFDTHEGQGIRIRLQGRDVEIDMTDAAVAQVLLKHLQPRFRALLEGVIR